MKFFFAQNLLFGDCLFYVNYKLIDSEENKKFEPGYFFNTKLIYFGFILIVNLA